MSSQLERIADWALLAKRARYQPKELAKLIKVSLRQLERYFLGRFARPPQDWLDELRLIHAAHHLAKGSRIKEVAEELGFQSVSHFSKKFNRFFGCRPSAFVQIHDRRLTERKRKFETWFPGKEVPPEWLADPFLFKPWDRILQQPRRSS